VTKFCAGIILTGQVMDCQTYAIGKAIRPLLHSQSHFMMWNVWVHQSVNVIICKKLTNYSKLNRVGMIVY